MNVKIDKKDDIVLKILHYFITEEDYKPVIINGINNEIWLENMESDLKLIRINTNYIHNNEQYKTDMYKAKTIMKTIKKTTMSLNMNMLNLLLDAGDNVNFETSEVDSKNVETVVINKINDFKKNKVVGVFFPKVKEAMFSEKMDEEEFIRLTDDMNKKTIKNEKKLAKIFSNKPPVITYALIVINLMVWLYLTLYKVDESVILDLANNVVGIRSNEIYRLFSSMFIHVDISHLIFNMYALFVVGPMVERYYGSEKYIFIYLLSGIMGNLFSCAFMAETDFSIGASGAIFGLFGSIVYFTYYYRNTLQGLLRSQFVPVILVNLCLGFLIPGIDVMAHIGGLLGGVLISMFFGIGDKSRKADQINGGIVFVAMAAFMVYIILTK